MFMLLHCCFGLGYRLHLHMHLPVIAGCIHRFDYRQNPDNRCFAVGEFHGDCERKFPSRFERIFQSDQHQVVAVGAKYYGIFAGNGKESIARIFITLPSMTMV